MLFNSQEFLFVFLPATLLGFYLLGRTSRQSAIVWLILTSLLFYGWWRPLNILIIGPSIIINYLLASFLLRLSQRSEQPRVSRTVLLIGILFNVAFLGFSNMPTLSTARSMMFSARISFCCTSSCRSASRSSPSRRSPS